MRIPRRIIIGMNLLWQAEGFWTMVFTLIFPVPPLYGFLICYDLGRMWETKWRAI